MASRGNSGWRGTASTHYDRILSNIVPVPDRRPRDNADRSRRAAGAVFSRDQDKGLGGRTRVFVGDRRVVRRDRLSWFLPNRTCEILVR